MSTLVVEELQTIITQDFFTTERINIAAVAPWLYMEGSPAGIFKIVITQNGLIIGSQDFTALDIETNTAATDPNYWHGVYKLLYALPFAINPGGFTVSLEHSGYTFQEGSYLGWVKPYVDKYNDQSHAPIDDLYNTLGLTLWGYSTGENMSRILDINDGFSSVTAPTVSSPVVQVGTIVAPILIEALVGYDSAIGSDSVIFVAGDGGPVDVTANPQIINAGTGTRIYLRGTSDVNTVKFNDGDGLNLNGPMTLGDGSVLELIKSDTIWNEVSRNE